MANDDDGKGGKPPEAPKNLEEALAAIKQANELVDSLQKEKRELLHETMDRKEKLRAFEKKQQEAEETRLKEEGKFKELVGTLEPKAKRLETLEPVLTELLTLEIADIPEDKRDLIPSFEYPEQKLKWVKQAKSKGLFAGTTPPGKPPVPPSDQRPPGSGATPPEFVTWGPNDPRLTSLKPDEYKVWKEHNRKPANKIAGWGG